MIATSGTDTRLRKTAKISDWNAVKEGALNSLTNPKSLLFMFAFLPQFVDPAAGPVWLQLLVWAVSKAGWNCFPGVSCDGIRNIWKLAR